MTLSPCLDCGEPTTGPRCTEHQPPDRKPPAAVRGYDAAWQRLSKRARKLQPWCTDCGSSSDLQADHTPQAWQRKAAGLPIRLQDIEVCCGPCNRRRGAARGQQTRGDDPTRTPKHPRPQAKFEKHTGQR